MSVEDNPDAFKITFRREIVFYLRQLVNDGELVTVTLNEGRDTMLTVMLDVDEESNTIVFDWGASEEINEKLLQSQRNYFIATPQGVRNQFFSEKVWKTTFNKRPALATAIPTTYVRLQRREFFRLTLPLTQRRPCVFKSAKAEKSWTMSVVDIGLGGVGLESPEAALPFARGETIPRAVIDLGKYGRLEADLVVTFIGSVTRGPKEVGRLGCQFVKLSPKQENDVQRFVTEVQREERAKLG